MSRPAQKLSLLVTMLLVPLASGCSLGPFGAARPPDRVLTIAVILPTSGADAQVGRAMRRGVDLAVRQHLRPAPGYRLTVIHVDERGVSMARPGSVLRKRHVLAIVGPLESGSAVTLLPAVEQRQIPTISPGATLPGLTQASQAKQEGLPFATLHPVGKPPAFFRIPEPDNIAGRAAAELTIAPAPGLAAHSVFVVDDGSRSGKALAGAFAIELGAKGGVVSGRGTVAPANPSSAQSVVTAIIEASPALVFYAGGTAAGAELRRTLSLTGAPRLGILTVGSIADDPGWSAAVGVRAASAYTAALLPAPDPSTLPRARRFAAAYHRAFPGKVLLPQSALAYDAVMDEIVAMQELIKERTVVTPSTVRSLIASTRYRGVTGTLAFGQNGDDLRHVGFSLYTCDLRGVWHYQRKVA